MLSEHETCDDVEPITIEEARTRCGDLIEDSLRSGEWVLVDSMMSLGKSYSAVHRKANTDVKITLCMGRGHKEQYDQFSEWCEKKDLSYRVLPSFKKDCPTAEGEHGSDWKQRVTDARNRGIGPQYIHEIGLPKIGVPPCSGSCPYRDAWDFDPSDYDVLIGHYTHAHVPPVVAGRTIIFDEFPGGAFESSYGTHLPEIVSAFLQENPDLGFYSFDDLLTGRDDLTGQERARNWFRENRFNISTEELIKNNGLHTAAPSLVYLLLFGWESNGGWRGKFIPRENESGRLAGVRGAYNGNDSTAHLLTPPDLASARSVLALDGTPVKTMWDIVLFTGGELKHERVLTDEERRRYLDRRLNIIRTTDAIKSYSGGGGVNIEQDAALLEAITEREGEYPALITSAKAESQYEAAGILERVPASLHYGNVLGSNDYKERRLGCVIGSQHYGDNYIDKWGVYTDATVNRNGKGRSLSYGEEADEFLEYMRYETIQAVMRFGRDGKGATVYVHTNTLPDWAPVDEVVEVEAPSRGLQQVVDAIRDLGTARTKDVAGHSSVKVSERMVRYHLQSLTERGYLHRERAGRGFEWSVLSMDESVLKPYLRTAK